MLRFDSKKIIYEFLNICRNYKRTSMLTISPIINSKPRYFNKLNHSHVGSYNKSNSPSVSFGANFTYDKLDKSKWYDTYIKYGNEKNCEAKVLRNLFNTKFNPVQSINVVDIGSGNGLLSGKIITDLSEIYPQNYLNYTAIDNSEKLLKIFAGNCQSKSDKVKIQTILQDFFAKNNDVGKYDYAIAAHSMYRSDLIPSIQTIQRTLSDKGKAFIIRSHPDSLMNYFRDKYHTETDALKSLHPTRTYMIPDLLKQTLEQEQINHKIIEVPYQIKLPTNSTDLKNILSFIIDTPIERLNPANIQALLADVERLGNDGMLHCKNNIFMIAKR